MKGALIAGAIILACLALLAIVHVGSAEASKNNPPLSCQLLGGTWNIWDGWRCA